MTEQHIRTADRNGMAVFSRTITLTHTHAHAHARTNKKHKSNFYKSHSDVEPLVANAAVKFYHHG